MPTSTPTAPQPATDIDLHDKKDNQPVPVVEAPFAKSAEENPGDPNLKVEDGKEADALPTAPAYTLTPQGQRVRSLKARLRNSLVVADKQALENKPETQLHRNQILGFRKNAVDLINEGYGTVSFDNDVVTITVPVEPEKSDSNIAHSVSGDREQDNVVGSGLVYDPKQKDKEELQRKSIEASQPKK